jgi:catechol 2,3-dioxygenase-like lactoylglutathione lyase family enzyme
MITALDHIVLLSRDIEAGIGAYQTLFGCAPAWRTANAGVTTALFTFANVSLELMAPSGDGPDAARVRAALEKDGEGLASLAVRVDDIARAHRRLQRVGLDPEPITEAESTDLVSGGTLRWRRTRAGTARTSGIRLFLLQLAAERPLSRALTDAPVTGLDHLVIATAQPERAVALYGGRFGLDMIRDLDRPDWNARLLFFRCGNLILEIMQRLDRPVADAPDRLWGLSWRVADVDATRARLAASGVEVSQVRAGRLPGTRVFTAKSSTLGVPTLIIQPQQRSDRE